jgi:hypothetical protein
MAKNGTKNGATDIVPVAQYAMLETTPEEVADIIAANAGSTGISERDFESVTMPTGGAATWTVASLTGEENVKSIDGIVIAFKDVRLMWKTSFDEGGGGSPPDCKADDGLTGIGDPGGPCHLCPLSKFGSDGKRGQQCGQYRMLLVLRPGSIIPIMLKLPPTSLKACRSFFMAMANQRMRYCDAVLRIGLEPTKNADGIKYSEATFTLAEVLPVEMREKIRAFNERLSGLLKTVQATG